VSSSAAEQAAERVTACETSHGLKSAGLTFGFTGAAIMLAPWNSTQTSLAGGLASLAASASYGASYVYMARYLADRDLSPIVLSACQLTAASGLLILATPFGGLAAPRWRLDATIGVVILGVVGTGIAYVLNYRIITGRGASSGVNRHLSTARHCCPTRLVDLG
jgi:drug/metabolite transporter (DMT)-like permease